MNKLLPLKFVYADDLPDNKIEVMVCRCLIEEIVLNLAFKKEVWLCDTSRLRKIRKLKYKIRK